MGAGAAAGGMSVAERRAVMDSMRENFDAQDAPRVGIFWYDPGEDELFGVTSEEAAFLPFNANGLKTIRLLHQRYWRRQQERERARGQPPGRFTGEYTQTPRGRIFQRQDGVFQLMCGSWITEPVVALVRDEFNLWEVPFEVKVDSHWEIGHGWSEEYL